MWGAGGHGSVVADAASGAGFMVVGWIDRDRARLHGLSGLTLTESEFSEIVASNSRESGREWDVVALGVGDNDARRRIFAAIPEEFRPAVIHPRAIVASSVRVASGAVVLAGAILNANARVGSGAIVNTGAIVEHDCDVGSFAHISPGAVLGGGARVGEGAWVGAAATVIHGIDVGEHAVVGAGAVVISNVSPGRTVIGNPARERVAR